MCEGDSSKERSSEEGCSQDNTTSSTSVYVDYLKCIFVPEKFGAYVVVANTGDRG